MEKLRALYRSVVGFAFEEAVRVWVWPLVLTSAGVVPLWLAESPVPWYFAPAAAVILFAFSALLLNSLSEWRWRNNIELRFNFDQGRAFWFPRADQVRGVNLGVQCRNDAFAKVGVRIERIRTKIVHPYSGQEWFAPNKGYNESELVIPSGGFSWYDDHPINLPVGLSGEIVAVVEGRIAYGRPRRLNYTMDFRKQALFYMHQGGVFGNGVWYEVSLDNRP